MKTKLATFILLMSFIYSNSQVIHSIGLRGGVSFATMTYKYTTTSLVQKYSYNAGIYSAVTAEFFNGKHVSFSTDLGFIQKGMKRKELITSLEYPEGNGEYLFHRFTRNYVSLSPMLKGYYQFNKVTAYVLAGPRIDLDITNSLPDGSNMNSKTHKIIFGLTYGLGAEYRINKVGILLEGQGQPNLTTIMDTPTSDTNVGLKVTGNSYVLTTGINYYFH